MIKISRKDLFWSYLSDGLQFGSNILILPLILRNINNNELALWFIFLTITKFAYLFDFGFQGNIMRNIAYVFSGATRLQKSGIDYTSKSDDVDYNLLKSVIRSVKIIYGLIALLSLLFLSIGGTAYILSITSINLVDFKKVFISWIFVVISTTLNIYFSYYTPFLMGRGLVKENKKALVYSNLIYLFSIVLFINFNFGLIGISIAFFIQSLSVRFFSHFQFYDDEIKRVLKEAKSSLSVSETISILWSNSWKLGLVTIGAFLITQANTLILPKYESLIIVAEYGLTLQVVNFLYRISLIYFNTYYPQLSSDRINNNKEGIINKVGSSLCFFIFSYLVGGFFIVIFGNQLLSLIGSQTQMLDLSLLIVILVMFFLEANHSISANIIASKNEIPFYKAALISGVAIVIIAILLFRFFKLGVWSIILAQFFVQLFYNNWRWPILMLSDINSNYKQLILAGIKNIKLNLK